MEQIVREKKNHCMRHPYSYSLTTHDRYFYQGSEMDKELKGDGNSYTTTIRQLDPRLGRWMSLDPKMSAWESPYASMGNNPVMNNDPLGDVFIGTNKKSARRVERNLKNETFAKDQFKDFRKLLNIKGGQFTKIDENVFNKAVQNLTPEEQALANGYFQMINSPDKYFVNVVKRGEDIDPNHKEMNATTKRWAASAASTYATGAEVEDKAGSVTYTSPSNNQVLAILVMNPKNKIDDYSLFDGTGNRSRTSTLGEKMAHELLGHGQAGRNSIPVSNSWAHNINAIQAGNLFLQVAYFNHGMFRDGTQHGGGIRPLTQNEATGIPAYLQYTSPLSTIPPNMIKNLKLLIR